MAKRPVKKTSDRSQVVTLTMENVEALKKGETIPATIGCEAWRRAGTPKDQRLYSLVEWFKGKKTRETIGFTATRGRREFDSAN